MTREVLRRLVFRTLRRKVFGLIGKHVTVTKAVTEAHRTVMSVAEPRVFRNPNAIGHIEVKKPVKGGAMNVTHH